MAPQLVNAARELPDLRGELPVYVESTSATG
jgi:hypothetical protein